MKMPIPVSETQSEIKTLSAENWTSLKSELTEIKADLLWNKNYYVEYKAVNP
jgi:hypothetical protein